MAKGKFKIGESNWYKSYYWRVFIYRHLVRTHTLKAFRHGSHSFTCKQHHACFSFVSVHQMALPLTEAADIELHEVRLTTHLSTPKGCEAGWVGMVGWPVADDISGHPSATGRAHDSESTTAKDRRSTAGPRNQTTQKFLNCPTKMTARNATDFTVGLPKKYLYVTVCIFRQY